MIPNSQKCWNSQLEISDLDSYNCAYSHVWGFVFFSYIHVICRTYSNAYSDVRSFVFCLYIHVICRTYSHAYLHVRGFVLCLYMVIHSSHAYHMFRTSCFVRTYTFTRIHIVMLIAISCIVLEYKTKLITGNALDMRR